MKQQQIEIQSLEAANSLLVRQIKINQLKEAQWQEEVQVAQTMGNANKAELEKAKNTIEALTQQL